MVVSGLADNSGQTDSSGQADSLGQADSSDKGGRRGGMSAYISKSDSTELSSPSAMVQWVKLPSALSLSMTLSPVASSEAGSRTWSDVMGSSSGAILSTVAPLGSGSSVAAGSGSPSAVGSGSSSAQRGDGGLGSGSSGVRDRGRMLSRHRMIASLQFNPVVSGRSMGQW